MVRTAPPNFKPEQARQICSKFHGKSLNNFFLVGPDLLPNLLFVLMRFREHKYAISADIEGMFMQVGLLESDQHSLRFLWREDLTSDVSVFQYTRHIFGAEDSPTCANYALRRTAVDNQDRYPKAAYAVLNIFYMDPETALALSRSLVELLRLGGFNLTIIISNVSSLSLKPNPLRPALTTLKKLLPLRLIRISHRIFSVSNGATSPIRWL